MVVITDRRLIERRAGALKQRRRAAAGAAPAEGPMPEWAIEALVALGMTRAEIASVNRGAPAVRAVPATSEEPARTADAIATLQAELAGRQEVSPAALHALAEIALARLKRGDPADAGQAPNGSCDARAVALFEHVVGGLARLRDEDWRRTG